MKKYKHLCKAEIDCFFSGVNNFSVNSQSLHCGCTIWACTQPCADL